MDFNKIVLVFAVCGVARLLFDLLELIRIFRLRRNIRERLLGELENIEIDVNNLIVNTRINQKRLEELKMAGDIMETEV